MDPHSYAEVRDAVADALSVPGANPNGPYPTQFGELVERVRAIFHQRQGIPYQLYHGTETLALSDKEVILDVLWEFIRMGVVNPGLNSNNLNLPLFHIAPLGRDILANGKSRFFDAETYVTQVQTAVPDIDAVALAYLREAAASFFNNCLLATAVMLGGAAEAEFERLATLVVGHPQHGAIFKGVDKPSQVAPRMDLLYKKMRDMDKQLPREITENLTTTYRGIQELLRISRNEAGHPAERQIDRDFAFAQLALFIPFAKQVAACRIFFKAV